MHKIFIMPLFFMLFIIPLAGCAQTVPDKPAANCDVAIEQALTDWNNKSAFIIDVRTSGEYAEGHIPGVKLIPLDQLPNSLDEVPKQGKVYIICRSGNRSSQATQFLRDKGFDNVYNVTSGMKSWRGPIEK